jgi:hypothetical protein
MRTARRVMEGIGFSPELVGEAFTFMRSGSTKEEFDLLHEELTPQRLAELKGRIDERRQRAATLRHPRRLSPPAVEQELADQIKEMRVCVERYDRRQADRESETGPRRRMGSGRNAGAPLNRSNDERQSRAAESHQQTEADPDSTIE